jgi:hypothetical protein
MNTHQQCGLQWWSRGSNLDYWWATSGGGRYVAQRDPASDKWTVTFRKRQSESALGTVSSLIAAKTLAESKRAFG